MSRCPYSGHLMNQSGDLLHCLCGAEFVASTGKVLRPPVPEARRVLIRSRRPA